MKHIPHLYGTFGPSCASEEIIHKLFLAGMTGMRLNLSHTTLEEASEWLSMYHRVAERMHLAPELLVDLQGPELRIGTLPDSLVLSEKDLVFLIREDDLTRIHEPGDLLTKIAGDREDFSVIPCPSILFSYLEEGQTVCLNDGKITLSVCSALEDGIFCGEVRTGGELSSRKSIAIEGLSIPLPTLTKKDRENLKLLRKFRVTGVMLPFVKTADDLINLKNELRADHMDYVRIFAKIESMEGVNNLPSFLPFCDEVIIARGDLGNAIPLSKLPALQKKISMLCLRARKPFMVVTQLLASMETNPVPTRAEVTDIFQAVTDGASSLMLTGETAVGHYPAEAMQMLSDTAFEALRFLRLRE
ncbi:MAG: pyruvate kinase [Eubacterium sp.]|nr:pyruvate kinase [Eubacterium sp.]MDD7210368.1 pyruvate kinase [Lachnospiraceae bacterium]MDY5496922.1 pyruvate kinase [Anaerobutyricum sp.]